jgi:hypothetical protein
VLLPRAPFRPQYNPADGSGRLAVSLKFRNAPRAAVNDTPAPHDYQRPCTGPDCGCNTCGRKGVTMGRRYNDSMRDGTPGPHYAVGVSTLGVAAQPTVRKDQLSLTVVL